MSDKATAWVTRPNGTIAELTSEGPGEVHEVNASDLSIGADGTVWIISAEAPDNDGEDLSGSLIKYKKDGEDWKVLKGNGATRIEGGPEGAKAYIVDGDGAVKSVDVDGKVELLSDTSFAREVSISANGTLWAISDDGVFGGAAVYVNDGSGWTQLPEEITATKIGGGPKGHIAYITNAFGQLSKIDKDGNYEQLTGEGFAREVSVDTNGNVWIVTYDADEDGGNTVCFQMDGEGAWTDVDGGGMRIDA